MKRWKLDQNRMVDTLYVPVMDLRELIEKNNNEYDLIFDPVLGDVVSCENKPMDNLVSDVAWVEICP